MTEMKTYKGCDNIYCKKFILYVDDRLNRKSSRMVYVQKSVVETGETQIIQKEHELFFQRT